MKIRLATRRDLKNLENLDKDPDRWAASDFTGFIQAFGQVKVALEGPWPLGWVAYRKVKDLIIIERLILPSGPSEEDLETEVAIRLVDHVEWLCLGAAAIDLAIPDSKLNVAKVLASRGYTPAMIRQFYPGGEDAILLNKRLKAA